MGRRSRDRRPRGPKPVERIAVSEKHLGRRVFLFFLCFTVALSALSYGVYSWLSTDPGWVEVETSNNEKDCGTEFVFRYLIREGGFQATDRLRGIRAAYNELAMRAYRMFTVYETFDDPDDLGVSHNLAYINSHPNEDIQVDPALYQAFSQAKEAGSTAIYGGPLYSVYNDLFFCEDDAETRELDPLRNEEAAQFCWELAAFANDPSHVSLVLLGNDTLRLNLSPEYQAYAEDAGRETYLDFGWMRSAFIADYMAGELAARGYTAGVISSYDGVTRQLGEDTGPQTFSFYDWPGERPVLAAQAEFGEPVNGVSLRTFPLNALDEERTYVFENGSLRHSYIDLSDGICRTVTDSLSLYSKTHSCSELILAAEPILFQGGLFPEELAGLRARGIDVVASNANLTLLYTDPGLEFYNIYSQPEQPYKTKLIP